MQAHFPGPLRNASHIRLTQALPVGEGMVYLGYYDRDDTELRVLNLLFDDGHEIRLPLDRGDIELIRTPHPVHAFDAGAAPAGGRGFVIRVPARVLRGMQPMLALNDQIGEIERVPPGTVGKFIAEPALLAAYGHALNALATRHGDKTLVRTLAAPLAANAAQRVASMLGFIEETWLCGKLLLVIGRWRCELDQLAAVHLHGTAKARVDVSAAIHSAPRAARNAQGCLQRVPGAAFALLQNLAAPGQGDALALEVTTHALGSFTFPLCAQPCTPAALPGILAQHPALAARILPKLRRELRGGNAQQVLTLAEHSCFSAQWANARTNARYEDLCAAAITAAYPLDDAGLVVVGALCMPDNQPLQAWLHAPDRPPLDVSERFVALPIAGDTSELAAALPRATRRIQFVLHAPYPTRGAAPRVLRFVLPRLPDLCLRIETAEVHARGPQLAREILGKLPVTDWFWRNFPAMLDRGLGAALQWAGRDPGARAQPRVHQFGTPPARPAVSIVVPLYGRNDFMRHQLAQFCDDPDFTEAVDLIYVVDDPGIETDTLNLAGRYQPLFRVPFRVVTYPDNRGFAGANNTAAAFARAPLLMLMNSDVLPQHAGWVTTLRNALARLPRCGMVAPLLQYADGSVQHAGMTATRQFANPELVFSMHPGKGTAWEGSEKPSVQKMLTGACLLLRRKDYDAVGGLDEGYLVGDFEDSDFSLRIRALGKHLYLVPAAKLWHLERQSQYLGANARGVRDMLTLYNAWRYRNKIAAGELLDPEA